MKDAFSTEELKTALGKTRQVIERYAKRRGWSYREERGHGRGGTLKLWLVESMDEQTRIALGMRQHAALAVITGGRGGKKAPVVLRPAKLPASQVLEPELLLPELPPQKMRKAAMKADLVSHYLTAKERAKRKCLKIEDARDAFILAYNTGVSYPVILAELGRTSWKTLERWAVTLRQSAHDCAALAERYGQHRKGESKVTEAEKAIVLRLLLSQNKIKIGTAIEVAKMHLEQHGIPSPSSPSTLRGFVNDFKAHYADVWTLAREGEKALTDKIAPFFERDISLLEVGDVLIADGHRCGFTVINPFTGKPVRPMLVAFLDWASRDIVGYAMMLQEDIQGIHLALYRAILRLGKMPKVVYLDNGAGFKAKVFTQDLDLEQTGMAGLYGRLGIMAVFAKPYNARSKVIEPFFKTLSDHFERFVPSFTGASIMDKPARMRRNEKFMQQLAPGTAISIEQSANAFESWLELYYRQRPHSGLGKRSPGEVFAAGRGEGVDPGSLRFLMMHEEVAHLENNGVPRFGGHYYDESLYGLRSRVLIRYDWHDLRSVHVYSMDGDYICEAKRTQGVHPMFALIGGKDAPGYAEFREQKRAQEALKRGTKKIVAEAARQGQLDGIREVLPIAADPRLARDLERIAAENTSLPSLPNYEISDDSRPAKPGRLIDPTSLDWMDDNDLDEAFQRSLQASTRR
jgi:putative transposase